MRVRLSGHTRSHRLMTGLPRVLLAGVDGQGHLGDEAVAEALVTGLRERLPDLRLTVAADDEERVRRWLEAATVPCADWALLAAALGAADLLVVGCGRALSDRDGFDPERALASDARGLAHTAGLTLLAATLGRPFVLASAATGPLASPEARSAVGALAALAARIVAAGEGSARRLVELGADPGRVEIGPDLAYALRPCPPARAADILDAAGLSSLAGALVAVVPPEGEGERPWAPTVETALFDLVRATEAHVVALPPRLEAAEAMERLCGRLPPGRAHVLPAGHRPREIAGVLGRCELVISLPRHGSILAAVGGAPVIPLAPLAGAAGDDDAAPELAPPPGAPVEPGECLLWAWQRRAELRQRVAGAAAALASGAARSLDRLASELGALSDPASPASPAALLAPALRGLLKRARVAGWERERAVQQVEARLAAQHRDLAGQIEDRDRLVRSLQAELFAKVGERDRLIRALQDEILAKVGERDRLIRELQERLAAASAAAAPPAGGGT